MPNEAQKEDAKTTVEELQNKCKDLEETKKDLAGDEVTWGNAYARFASLFTLETSTELEKKSRQCELDLAEANAKLKEQTKNALPSQPIQRGPGIGNVIGNTVEKSKSDTGK